jgi:hypothetical protein
MSNKKPKEEKVEKLICIEGADKSLLGPDSIFTDKESELRWNKHPNREEFKPADGRVRPLKKG